MKKCKKVLSILLVATMLVSVAGCNSDPAETDSEDLPSTVEVEGDQEGGQDVKDEESEDDREVVAQEQTGEGTVGTVEDGPFGRYEEPITITFVRTTSPTNEEKINTVAEGWGTVETWEDNRWTRLFKDELNINVEYEWIANDQQFEQKWKMSMAAGEIPDISKVDLIDLNHLTEAGLIQEMGMYWDEYATDSTKSIVEADGELVYDAISVDGKMMGVPQVMAALDNYRYLWLRTDWMENLNKEAPTTMEEFVELMGAFVTEDPDGNGEDDTYAMLMDKTLWYTLEGFFWAFDAYPDTWLKTSEDTLVYGAIQPEMKDALQTLQDMYNNGWLDEEFVVKDYSKSIENISAGKLGVASGGHWQPYDFSDSRENNPDADWGCFEWPSATGEPVKGEIELGLRNTLAVREDFEHPEAIIKMLNLYYEKLYGETGDYSYWGNDRKTGVDGVWWFGPMDSFHPLVNIIPYRDAVSVVNGEMEEEDLQGASLDYYNNCLSMWEWERMWFPGNNSAGDHIEMMLQEDRLFTDNFVGASTPTMTERWSQMNELMDTTFTKIITGELEVETGFNEFVEDWKNIGGDTVTVEVNEWYDATK